MAIKIDKITKACQQNLTRRRNLQSSQCLGSHKKPRFNFYFTRTTFHEEYSTMNFNILSLILILHKNNCFDAQDITTEDNITVNETKGDSTIEMIPDSDQLDIYDDSDTEWIKTAVVEVAYYLRSHKFNDFDRRSVWKSHLIAYNPLWSAIHLNFSDYQLFSFFRYYNKTPAPKESNLFGSFPNPPLKHFHWNVFSQCKTSFTTCLRYLYETVMDAYLQVRSLLWKESCKTFYTFLIRGYADW